MLLRRHSSISIPVHFCVRLIWEMSTAPGELKATAASVTNATNAMIVTIITDDLQKLQCQTWGRIFSGPMFLQTSMPRLNLSDAAGVVGWATWLFANEIAPLPECVIWLSTKAD